VAVLFPDVQLTAIEWTPRPMPQRSASKMSTPPAPLHDGKFYGHFKICGGQHNARSRLAGQLDASPNNGQQQRAEISLTVEFATQNEIDEF
jgi:hypothetical protein